jgi:ABC-type antimicrobial peptide transport system permease subunit
MAAFGTVALVFACLGIFAVTSYVVTERTSEIGMRGAMGTCSPVAQFAWTPRAHCAMIE